MADVQFKAYAEGGNAPYAVHAPQVQNLSQYFGRKAVEFSAGTNVTTTDAAYKSPDAWPTSVEVAETAVTSSHFVSLLGSISFESGKIYNMSVFVKDVTRRYVQLLLTSPLSDGYANVDLADGSIGHSSRFTNIHVASVVDNWWRVSFDFNCTVTGDYGGLFVAAIRNKTDNRLPNFLGDPNNRFLAWGFQVVEGAGKLSYPIYTNGASVSRDVCALSFAPANWDNDEVGWYGEFVFEDDSSALSKFLAYSGGNVELSDSGANSQSIAAAVGARKVGVIAHAEDNLLRLNVDGAWSAGGPYNGTLPDNVLDLFRVAAVHGKARKLRRYRGSVEHLQKAIDKDMAA